MKKILMIALAAIIVGFFGFAQAKPASACDVAKATDCGRQHVVASGPAPIWKVSYCFLPGVGEPGSRVAVDCGPAAVHDHGRICFVASDGHEYKEFLEVTDKATNAAKYGNYPVVRTFQKNGEDFVVVRIVAIGAPFVNLYKDGRWQRDWKNWP